ncbi:MAG TPA: ATPase, T2SS/T4P/T4SS family, partial [Kofleriaceae bacterium]
MFTILIQEKGGEQRRMVFNKAEVTIGRVQGNDIVLPKGNVSKRHARIVLKDGKFIIVDLKSTNGTYVNGRKITSPLVVKDSDKIYIGDFIVGVDEASASEGEGMPEATSPPPVGPPSQELGSARPPRPTEAQPLPPSAVPMASPMETPPPAPAPAPAATVQGPGPSRAVPPRPAPGPAREPAAPPVGASPSERPRPGVGRPGGTMPPPIMSPIPPIVGGPGPAPAPAPLPAPGQMPGQMHGENPAPTPLMAAPQPPAMAAPQPAPAMAAVPPAMASQGAAMPSGPALAPRPIAAHAPAMDPAPQAQVVPMPTDKKPRGLVGAGAKRVPGRSVSLPNRRGVQLDPLDPKIVKMLDLQSNILERLRAKLDLDKIPMDRLHEEDLWQRAERATIDLVETLETSGELPKYIDQDTLIKEALNEALALGPLEDLLADEQIDEIIIDRRDRLVVGKGGVLRGSGKAFSSDDVFEKVVKRLVAEAGAMIDDTRPLVDLRMRDGTRLTAAVSPVAARGAVLVVKKRPAQMPKLAELVTQNALTAGMADFLATCVAARRNILVCGAPSSGKTTIAAALAAASPPGERVVSIEAVSEISIGRDEWIQLEARPGSGRHAEIDLGHLLETALRLAPDRLVVGEVRGREALPLVQALCSTIDGAVVAMTGEGASAALGRVASLARLSLPGADGAIRELVAQAFEIVVHVARWSDGSLRVLSIEEVVGCSETTFDTHVLFQFQNGAFTATGTVPRFYAELEARGIPA